MSPTPHGLILVSGPTGSGKSSTLAALIQEINLTESRHILTIESPIEYTFRPRRAYIRQREVGRDTPSFEQALLDSLREDPDVLMVGEMREPETMRLTLNASETGHLVLATVHSSTCAEALQRIVSAFPAEIQSSVAAAARRLPGRGHFPAPALPAGPEYPRARMRDPHGPRTRSRTSFATATSSKSPPPWKPAPTTACGAFNAIATGWISARTGPSGAKPRAAGKRNARRRYSRPAHDAQLTSTLFRSPSRRPPLPRYDSLKRPANVLKSNRSKGTSARSLNDPVNRKFEIHLPQPGPNLFLALETFSLGRDPIAPNLFWRLVSKGKALADSRAAYQAGQQDTMLRLQQVRGPTVIVAGQVKNSLVPWTVDLTVAKAIVLADYFGAKDPQHISILRNGQPIAVDPKGLLRGEDVPLQFRGCGEDRAVIPLPEFEIG